MKKPQKIILTYLLFIVGGYGEQLLSFINTLIVKFPDMIILIIAFIIVKITE